MSIFGRNEMKKHFIAALLFLNVTCAMHADTAQKPSDAFASDFVQELNSGTGDYIPPAPTGLTAVMHTVAEHMPEAVMLAIVVTICNYDEVKQWVYEKYALTREKFNNLKQYIWLKFERKASAVHEQK